MSEPAVHIAAAHVERDGEALIALNNAAVPAVNAITFADLRFFAREGDVIAAHLGGDVAGLLVLLPPGAPYESNNYAWFSARYPAFLYVDRIVVSPAARGTGLGRALYERGFEAVRAAGHGVLLAEVNTRPNNPGSLAFHARMGFSPVEERENPVSGKRVLMQERRVKR